MRYIYAFRKKEERNRVNLTEYKYKIKSSLESLNIKSENYVIVNKDSFEFSFSGCVSRGNLQKMGKLLVRSGVGKDGFIRQNNKAYAILTYDETKAKEEQVLVELVDRSTLNLEDEEMQEEEIQNEEIKSDMPEWVKFYRGLELSTTYISVEKAAKIFGISNELSIEREVVLLVDWKHRHLENERYYEYLESAGIYELASDINYRNPMRENTCLIEHLYSAGIYQPESVDLADVKVNGMVSASEKEYVMSKFKQDIESYIEQQSDTSALGNQNAIYTFTVHNVGQALATSIREKGKMPFFYFDYGIACRNNKFTLPADVELPIAEGATILLSHVDEDHWCGYRINPDALKCRWMIPQKPTKALAKVLSSVYLNGGTITLYQADGLGIFNIKSVNNCMVAGNAKSKINAARIPVKVHENGIALYILAEHRGKNWKIVVSGDQDYDYQDDSYLKDINLLVACHHGGRYSWSNRAIVPNPNLDENEIVYSYGARNTYGHPSKVGEYANEGWNTEHHTPRDGDYEIDLELIDNTSIKSAIKVNYPTGMEFEV